MDEDSFSSPGAIEMKPMTKTDTVDQFITLGNNDFITPVKPGAIAPE